MNENTERLPEKVDEARTVGGAVRCRCGFTHRFDGDESYKEAMAEWHSYDHKRRHKKHQITQIKKTMFEQDNDIKPYTEQAAERLESGFDPACKGIAVEVAEVRESLSDEYPAVKEVLKQAEHCLNRAGSLYVDGGGYEDDHGHR